MFKPFLWMCATVFSFLSVHAKEHSWLLGQWNGGADVPGSYVSTQFITGMHVFEVEGNLFRAIMLTAIPSNRSQRVENRVEGIVEEKGLKLTSSQAIYYKNPDVGAWCLSCFGCGTDASHIFIKEDKIFIRFRKVQCSACCDGETTYYRDLSEFSQDDRAYLIGKYAPPGTAIKPEVAEPAAPRLNRPAQLVQTITTKDPEITIELFDNGIIDGDTVTVYHNESILFLEQRLEKKPLVFTFRADARQRIHEFIMVAENLGSVPPNTSVMKIKTGNMEQLVRIETNGSQNGKIIIEYQMDE